MRPSRRGIIHHGAWQVAAIRTCQKHGRHLVAAPKPKNGNDRFDHVLMLDSFNRQVVIGLCLRNMELERYLTERIQNGPGTNLAGPSAISYCRANLRDVWRTSDLGAEVKRTELTDAQWAAAGTAGLSSRREGTEVLRQKLKDIKESAPAGAKLYRSHYGVFFDWLRSRADDPLERRIALYFEGASAESLRAFLVHPSSLNGAPSCFVVPTSRDRLTIP